MSTTTCTCCRGRRCVRVRSLGEISFDGALRRLQEKLAREQQATATTQGPADDRPVEAPPRPWEMSRLEFEAAAEPTIESAWGTSRYRGLSRSLLRREVHFLLRCPGAPVGGYRVRVPARRADLLDQPHRAFVEAALAAGLVVPSRVLSDYPELQRVRWDPSPPRLDFTANS